MKQNDVKINDKYIYNMDSAEVVEFLACSDSDLVRYTEPTLNAYQIRAILKNRYQKLIEENNITNRKVRKNVLEN